MAGADVSADPARFGQETDNEAKYADAGRAEGLVLARFRRQVTRRAAATRPQRVLDAGCGEGHVTEWLRAALPVAFCGVDGREEAVAAYRERNPGAEAHVGDLRALELPDDAFDLVVCTEVLEHLPDPAGVVAELARVCAPTGRVLVTVPHEPFFRGANLARGRYVRRLGSTPGHRWTWGRRGLTALLATALDEPAWFSSFPWQGAVAAPRAPRA